MDLSIRRPRTRLATAVLAAAGIASMLAWAPAQATAQATWNADACTVTWGSTPEHLEESTPYWITDARTGQHPCFDRFVVDISTQETDSGPGYDVQYVDQVHEISYDYPPAGDVPGPVVPLRGGARLQILVNAPAYGEDGYTFRDRNERELTDVSGYRTFRQVAYAGTYHPLTVFGLGVRARLPFRAFLLKGQPSRVVVDVAHHW
ncbi:MAG: hypothetical protein QOE58_3065 [Actinomycetota bacterium]|jgi:hypothetical protein|nr:hypothetical protein [Actinomycetota bacterium]